MALLVLLLKLGGLVSKLWTLLKWCSKCKQNLQESMEVLRKKVAELSLQEGFLETKLEKMERQYGKKPKAETQNWLTKVQKTKLLVDEIGTQFERANFVYRVCLGKLIENSIKKATMLVEEGAFPDGLFVDEDFKEDGCIAPLIGRESDLESIWKLLMTDEVLSVGVCGMAGVGKTSIVNHIHNRLLKHGCFSGNIFFVTVPQQCSIYKLQDVIADAANLSLRKNNEADRAKELCEMLRDMGFILILDNIWESFELDRVKVPLQQQRAKVLFTTHSLNACKMNCQAIVKVEPLTKEDSLQLFLHSLGPLKFFEPQVEETMISVVKECAGLPLAIVVTAKCMRGSEEISDWRNALRELKEHKDLSSCKNLVFGPLKLSFDRLESENLKQCLLYCSLFPEDYNIPRRILAVYWAAEGLIEEDSSWLAQIDRAIVVMNKLVSANLLERVNTAWGESCVKMHDVIRDMALSITSVDQSFMVKADVHLNELPGERLWVHSLERVSLMENSFEGPLSDLSPKCPKLKTLLLQYNDLCKLPNLFFIHMQSLQVLDMSWLLSMEYLPDSVAQLLNLRVLLLQCCRKLKYVPSLANLEQLQSLDLSETSLEEAPRGMERMLNLKFLNFSMTPITKFPSSELWKVSNLQYFRVDSCDVDVSLEPLRRLKHLETLGIKFSDVKMFKDYVRSQHWKKLKEYKIQVGSFSVKCGRLNNRQVVVGKCSTLERGKDFVLPRNVQELGISECHCIVSLLDLLPALEDAKNLEKCKIDTCNGMESIWSEIPDTGALRSLKALGLHDLPNLRAIFGIVEVGLGAVGDGSFANLQELSITGCGKITYLFTPKSVKDSLQNLQHLLVSDCSALKYIVARDEHDEGNENSLVVVPNLLSLRLLYLAGLRSLYGATLSCSCPSLHTCIVAECPKLDMSSFSIS